MIIILQKAERSQALDARFKAMHTWSKTKKAEKRKDDSDENLSDDEQLTPREAEKDEEEVMPLNSYKSKVKRKRNESKRK